ncbi:hypothetical protein VTK56DRAFT_8064 [Thermocarpiscus australiensis]
MPKKPSSTPRWRIASVHCIMTLPTIRSLEVSRIKRRQQLLRVRRGPRGGLHRHHVPQSRYPQNVRLLHASCT